MASEDEEMRRLEMALPIIRQAQPNAVISVDTFRASVARQTVEKFGADIINDVEKAPIRTCSVPWLISGALHSHVESCQLA